LATSKRTHYGPGFLPAALAEWKSLPTALKQQFQARLRRPLTQPTPGSEWHGLLRGRDKIQASEGVSA